MATYAGMNLGGEIRESVSLDEDDLSDVEDEVFIRDGKNGYKFEDVAVKRPLMAPRRKLGRSNITTKLKARPPCGAMCKPCCYGLVALTILIGLIISVVVLVSMFPLPLDKLRDWIITRATSNKESEKLLPCSDFKVTNLWSVNFPKLITESAVRTIDINQDGIEDVVIGFGIGEDNILHPELFCPMFMNKTPPCQGGVIALNGADGNTLWKLWLPYAVFTVSCTVDINSDNISDCLITGRKGILCTINAKNGTLIWQYNDQNKEGLLTMDVYSGNFIPDQNNDNIADILVSHISRKDHVTSSCLLIISGHNGEELHKISLPAGIDTYDVPQLFLHVDGNYSVLFGTGTPSTPGNFSLIPLQSLINDNMTLKILYQDSFKGILSPAVLVDITGDQQVDIVAATFNSTLIAIDGKTFKQIWNFTIPNSETLSIPTPGYFNSDNVTDFLIKYQIGPSFPTYYYSQTWIIDGKTGKPINNKPIIDSVGSQISGLNLAMESYGFDSYLFWIAECKNFEGRQDTFEFLPGSTLKEQARADLCKLRFNSSMVAKLYALNQFLTPPGVEIYNSENASLIEFNNARPLMEEAKEYLKEHPNVQQQSSETESSTDEFQHDYEPLRNIKYKDGSNFRHKDDGRGLVREFMKPDNKAVKNTDYEQPKYNTDYDQSSESWRLPQYQSNFPIEDVDADYNTYMDNFESPFNQNKLLLNENIENSNRDPRSKSNNNDDGGTTTEKNFKKKSLNNPKYGIYDYKNIRMSHNRLLHDLNNLPSDILRDTYFKNRESLLRKSKFEQRDLKSHEDRIRENEEIKKVIDQERKASLNLSENLWDLESEKEHIDKELHYWRVTRSVNNTVYGIPRLTTIGALVKSLNSSVNSIDLVLVTYWLPPQNGALVLLDVDVKCISEKIRNALNSKDELYKGDKAPLEDIFMKKCIEERGALMNEKKLSFSKDELKNSYLNHVAQLSLGQMTVYRFQIECTCDILKKGERCAKFLSPQQQSWSSYLGRLEDGVFKTHS